MLLEMPKKSCNKSKLLNMQPTRIYGNERMRMTTLNGWSVISKFFRYGSGIGR